MSFAFNLYSQSTAMLTVHIINLKLEENKSDHQKEFTRSVYSEENWYFTKRELFLKLIVTDYNIHSI